MKILMFFILFNFNQTVISQNYLSYVCHSFLDYWRVRDLNPDCYYTGDVFSSFEKIASSYGYDTQIFEVTTEDDYILKVFRISAKRKVPAGEPILLEHGTSTSSTAFTLVGNHSLAFILAEEGYDVWIANFRGTTYSSGHKYLDQNDTKYWNFSFHEYGIYDVKAVLDTVSHVTNQKVIYIGYSVGARAYYVYNTVYPQEAMKKLRVSISLAPTPFLHLNKSPLYRTIQLVPYWILKQTLDALFPGGVFQRKTFQSTQMILHFCLDSPFQVSLCELAKSLGLGFNFPQDAPETFPVVLGQTMEATSLKLFYHTEQSIRDKQFRQFDYGIIENIKHYGTTTPPIYNFSEINVPNYIFYATGDFLSTEKNVRLIYQKLPERAKPFGAPFKIEDENFSHSNFIDAKDVKSLLYDHVVKFLKEKKNYFND